MKWVRIISVGLLLIFLQTMVFNNLHVLGVCHPWVYLLFLVCLPVMPPWAEQLIGCVTGVMMDCICSTPGIHTAACVMVSWLKPVMLSRMVQESERIVGPIVPHTAGILPFIRLTTILTVMHHLLVFSLDAWSWSLWYWVLIETIVSSAVTVGVIFVYGFLLHRS
ncbi:MAG: rod shape-determining protein MreD [Paludibacteraceae bacterium]|nr:rod shape-determining protein MreD [Paludibacteraceae bacterium]